MVIRVHTSKSSCTIMHFHIKYGFYFIKYIGWMAGHGIDIIINWVGREREEKGKMLEEEEGTVLEGQSLWALHDGVNQYLKLDKRVETCISGSDI